MKINHLPFWLFSLGISLLSSYSFQLSSLQLYNDPDYMQSLQLPPDADTPMIAIVGVLMLTYMVAAGHVFLLTAFYLLARSKGKQIAILSGDFLFSRNSPLTKTILQLLAYLISVMWIWDFVETTKVKFFGSMLLFTILAILVTWVYGLWIINLTRKDSITSIRSQDVPEQFVN